VSAHPNFPHPTVPPWSPSSFCSQTKAEDEYLSPEVRLHITFEVVSQLDKVEVFRSLLSEEHSLHDLQIRLLHLVVEAQDDAPSLSQEPPQTEMDDECLRSKVLLHIVF
jgi:hypothetical protein